MLIGISGHAGSGKDTASDFLVAHHGFVKVALADPLKRIAKDVFNFTDEQLWGPSSARDAEDTRYRRHQRSLNEQITADCDAEVLGFTPGGPTFLTPRYALQQLGTNWGRDCYENVWIDYALRIANRLLYQNGIARSLFCNYDQKNGLYTTSTPMGPRPKGVVISDVRWPAGNEGTRIRAEGGLLLRMKRGSGLSGAAGQHVSETTMADVPDHYFDAVADNGDWSLDQLESFMASFVEQHQHQNKKEKNK